MRTYILQESVYNYIQWQLQNFYITGGKMSISCLTEMALEARRWQVFAD